MLSVLRVLWLHVLIWYSEAAKFSQHFNVSSSVCSMLCSQTDESLDICWSKTKSYVDEQLLKSLNDWVAVQVNIDQWLRRNKPSYNFDFSNMTREQHVKYVQEVSNRFSTMKGDYFIFDMGKLPGILVALLNNTFDVIRQRAADSVTNIIYVEMPEFRCPVPCSYDTQLWKYLFVGSLLVNLALVLVVVPFIVKTERSDKRLYSKQQLSFGIVGNNSNNVNVSQDQDNDKNKIANSCL